MTDDRNPLFRAGRKLGLSRLRRRRVEPTPPPVLDERERRVVDAFHRLYYDRHETTWTSTSWLGTTVLKCPLDLWNYQEILAETRPDLIIETGTHVGGSALYMAGICDLIGNGRIVTVDIEDRPARPVHGRITYVEGSSTSAEVLDQVTAFVQDAERVMVILDSDHSREHVLRELELYAPLVSKGCYLVVEDTNVNGHPVVPGFGPGPMEALNEFLSGSNDFEVDRSREKLMLTFNPSGYLLRVR